MYSDSDVVLYWHIIIITVVHQDKRSRQTSAVCVNQGRRWSGDHKSINTLYAWHCICSKTIDYVYARIQSSFSSLNISSKSVQIGETRSIHVTGRDCTEPLPTQNDRTTHSCQIAYHWKNPRVQLCRSELDQLWWTCLPIDEMNSVRDNSNYLDMPSLTSMSTSIHWASDERSSAGWEAARPCLFIDRWLDISDTLVRASAANPARQR